MFLDTCGMLWSRLEIVSFGVGKLGVGENLVA